MANKTRSTFLKRQKELARQTKRKDKQAKRLEKKAESETDGGTDVPTETEDPDLAGIRLGPQPRRETDEADEDQAGHHDER